MTDDIDAKIDRLETIIEQLEQGEVSLDRATALHTEGREILAELDAEVALDEDTVDEVTEQS
ncbi:exodeoxyribonuclease VII small subunit [Haloplanus natans]|uniref:exodeoxyribonuclease VII small subunit n=1 Tax=Haloplanus natans TaxID=376171 RepID=UPI0006780C9D|nr:exodeoxyribonuclease VII small subunit [Haloplanus natans]